MQSMPNAMFEKYDVNCTSAILYKTYEIFYDYTFGLCWSDKVTLIGLPGGGGEYDVQLGMARIKKWKKKKQRAIV
jgi:hypothetical protein